MDAGPARRFLHVCYCCADAEPVTRFFVDGLAMRNAMNTPRQRSDGTLLGLAGEIESGAAFLYDARGPRTSPAIEVQDWYEPPLAGTPVTDPTAIGLRAVGFGVADAATVVSRLTSMGCTVAGAGKSPFGTTWTTLHDPTGITLDVVEDEAVPQGETRMRHIRITCADLGRSLPWYEGLGFSQLGTATIDEASFLGLDGEGGAPATATAVRLRLPDEPCELLLVQWTEPASHGRHYAEANHAGLYRAAVGVDDTRAAYDAMVAAGWTFDHAPTLVELHGTPVPDMWICFLRDPDGVPFEFVQRPRSVFR